MNEKTIKEDIKALYAHADVANNEMSHIKEDISGIKVDINWIKQSLEDAKKAFDKFDTRTWTLLATIIGGFLITIAVQLLKLK